MAGRVLICGDRNWTDRDTIFAVIKELISQYGDEISVIHGAASGVDRMAGDVAVSLELVTVAVPAKWGKYGNRAGPLRNKYMLEKCKPHLVIAFHPDISQSKGTKHMVGIARQAGTPVLVIPDSKSVELINNELPESMCPKAADARTEAAG